MLLFDAMQRGRCKGVIEVVVVVVLHKLVVLVFEKHLAASPPAVMLPFGACELVIAAGWFGDGSHPSVQCDNCCFMARERGRNVYCSVKWQV